MKRLIFFLLLAFFCIASSSCKSREEKSASLLRDCPEEWIQNKMPGGEPSEYFIYKGERRELKDFDLNWIEKNCNIKPQIVQ